MSERIPESMGKDPSPEETSFDRGDEVHAHSGSTSAAMTGTQTRDEGTAEKAKARVEEAGRKAKETADENLTKAAGGLETAAERLREKTPDEGMMGEASEKVASGVESAAGYLRDKDTSQIVEDIESYAREHPMQAVGGALVAGFLIGRILR